MHAIEPKEKVGALAARYPWALPVFIKVRIDFSCGGHRTLEQACRDLGLDIAVVIDEIRSSHEDSKESASWLDQPLHALIDHILRRFHRPLPDALSQVAALAIRAYAAHRELDETRLSSLLKSVEDLRDELMPHLQKEEQVLFPWIRSGNGSTAGDPVRIMNLEHESAVARLGTIRELTNGFDPPVYACETVHSLYAALRDVDTELREHIHLENNILFPRALRE